MTAFNARQLHDVKRELEGRQQVQRVRGLFPCGEGVYLAWVEIREPWPKHQIAVTAYGLEGLERVVCKVGLEASALAAWDCMTLLIAEGCEVSHL